MSEMRALCLALFLACASSQMTPFFTAFNGRVADPCNMAQLNCPTYPAAATTVLIPSLGSVTPVAAPTTRLNLTGFNFPTTGMAGFTGAMVGLSPPINPNTQMASCAAPVDMVAVTFDTSLQASFVAPAAWFSRLRELEDNPRRLCFFDAATMMWRFTGFHVGVTWNCDDTVPAQTCTNLPVNEAPPYDGLTVEQQQQRRARSFCCRTTLGPFPVGQCINRNVQDCCGSIVSATQGTGQAFNIHAEQCCSNRTFITQRLDLPCPCWRGTATTDCPTGETCCVATKYPEINGSTPNAVGQCYRAPFQCCNTGQRFDPGSQQCCPINGLQSVNTPCPCRVDGDCGHAYNRCCRQINPIPEEGLTEQCTIYNNFPTGTGPYQLQRCLGTCFDQRYQRCCNGVTCISEYEKCCNSSCCNTFTASCNTARRAQALNQPNNFIDYGTEYLVCTTHEHINPLKSFWIFVLPTILLFLTFISVAVVLVFANKASSRSYSFIEKAMIAVALLLVLVSLPFFFSPAYKYAALAIFVALVVILSAAARIRWLNIVALALTVLLLLYFIDPLHGNLYFTLASGRTTTGAPDPESAGILHFVGKMWRTNAAVMSEMFCVRYYDYFYLDPLLRDTARFDNPAVVTFGYCDRGWVMFLLVFAALALILALILFILTLLALLLRFQRAYEPIALEIREAGTLEKLPVY